VTARPGEAALAVEGLHAGYGAESVLQGVSCAVARGEIVVLFGPNGCGKTTLFRCCLGLLRPTAGRVCAEGHDIGALTVRQRARLLAYVPQEHGLAFPYRVRDVVLMGRTPHVGGWLLHPGRAHRDAAQAALERVGIADLAERRYPELSGGQRQLVLIARALAQATPVMLLDEPTSHLDYRNQVRIWRTLQALAAEGISLVVCSHDPNHAVWFADRVVVLHEHRVLASGAPSTVFIDGALDRVYDGHCTVSALDGTHVVIPRGIGSGSP